MLGWGSFRFLWCVSQTLPLTLALSPWERGLTEVFGRGTPTWDTELNSGFEQHFNRPLTTQNDER